MLVKDLTRKGEERKGKKTTCRIARTDRLELLRVAQEVQASNKIRRSCFPILKLPHNLIVQPPLNFGLSANNYVALYKRTGIRQAEKLHLNKPIRKSYASLRTDLHKMRAKRERAGGKQTISLDKNKENVKCREYLQVNKIDLNFQDFPRYNFSKNKLLSLKRHTKLAGELESKVTDDVKETTVRLAKKQDDEDEYENGWNVFVDKEQPLFPHLYSTDNVTKGRGRGKSRSSNHAKRDTSLGCLVATKHILFNNNNNNSNNKKVKSPSNKMSIDIPATPAPTPSSSHHAEFERKPPTSNQRLRPETNPSVETSDELMTLINRELVKSKSVTQDSGPLYEQHAEFAKRSASSKLRSRKWDRTGTGHGGGGKEEKEKERKGVGVGEWNGRQCEKTASERRRNRRRNRNRLDEISGILMDNGGSDHDDMTHDIHKKGSTANYINVQQPMPMPMVVMSKSGTRFEMKPAIITPSYITNNHFKSARKYRQAQITKFLFPTSKA